MKVLFVCYRNVGRSQMAEAMFNKMSSSGHADSAGIAVETEGQTLGERSKFVSTAEDVISLMKSDENLDISSKKRNQLMAGMADDYDRFIVIISDPAQIPDWVRKNPKFEQWHIVDPRSKNLEEVREIKNEIKNNIQKLILTDEKLISI